MVNIDFVISKCLNLFFYPPFYTNENYSNWRHSWQGYLEENTR